MAEVSQKCKEKVIHVFTLIDKQASLTSVAIEHSQMPLSSLNIHNVSYF